MKDKFNLIFIVGCEGTGHNLFEECQLKPKPYTNLHELIMKYFNVNTSPTKQDKLKKSIFKITKKYIGTICKESASYPYGRPTNPLMSHDILSFYELFSEMPHVNLFFLVLTRNIIYSTLSAKRRFDPERSIIYSSRLQENCLNYINSQIQLIPREKYIIVELTNIQKNIEKFLKLFEEKSKIKISCNIKNIKVSDNSRYLKYKDYDYLVKYFNENRLKQYDFLTKNTFLIK